MKANSHEISHDSMLPRWLKVGFTGHRHLTDEAKIRTGIALAFDQLAGHADQLATISSVAIGADTIFQETAQSREMVRFVILPFDRDTFRKDFDDAQWTRSEALINTAIQCEVLSGEADRSESFLDAGMLTVDRCDVMIACWNGQAAAGKGGTADVVAYARRINKPLIIIDKESGSLAYERLELLPPELKHEASRSKSVASPTQMLEDEYRRLSHEARQHGPKSRNLVLWLILLHLGASAVATFALIFFGHSAPHATIENAANAVHSVAPEQQPAVVDALSISNEQSHTSDSHTPLSMLDIAVAMIKGGALLFALYLVRSHHHASQYWIESRLGTELCRSYKAIWKLRRSPLIEPEDEALGLTELSRSLKMLWYLGNDQALDLEAACKDYRTNRIEDQRNYYEGQLSKSEPTYIWGKRIAVAGTCLAIVAAIASLWLHSDSDGWMYKSVKSASLLLPLATAAILSYIVALDMGRRTIRYKEMIEILTAAGTKLDTVRTWSGLWRLVKDTESKLHREVTEWHAVTRFGGESH